MDWNSECFNDFLRNLDWHVKLVNKVRRVEQLHRWGCSSEGHCIVLTLAWLRCGHSAVYDALVVAKLMEFLRPQPLPLGKILLVDQEEDVEARGLDPPDLELQYESSTDFSAEEEDYDLRLDDWSADEEDLPADVYVDNHTGGFDHFYVAS